jgi:hypothetical protein
MTRFTQKKKLLCAVAMAACWQCEVEGQETDRKGDEGVTCDSLN